MIESQADYGLQGQQILADTAYGSDENVEDCREAGIQLISPVAGKAPAEAPATLTPSEGESGNPDKKLINTPIAAPSRTSKNETASANGKPSGNEPNEPSPTAARKARLEARRGAEKTEVWKKTYAKRSGQEGINRALDRVTGSKRLVVRGKRSVSMALYLKTVGWNILRAGWAYAQRGIADRKKALQAA